MTGGEIGAGVDGGAEAGSGEERGGEDPLAGGDGGGEETGGEDPPAGGEDGGGGDDELDGGSGRASGGIEPGGGMGKVSGSEDGGGIETSILPSLSGASSVENTTSRDVGPSPESALGLPGSAGAGIELERTSSDINDSRAPDRSG